MTDAPGESPGAWILEAVDGLVLARCGALAAVPGIAHAFSTRRAGVGDGFDLGSPDDRSESTLGRRARFLEAAGIEGVPAVLRQVHGGRVVDAEEAGESAPEADAAVWTGGRFAPSVRTADCVPLLIADRAGRAAAAVHAGWRGTSAGIVLRATEALAARGVSARELVAALGPAIGGCCYEVGPEVVEAVSGPSGRLAAGAIRPAGNAGRHLLDLRAVVRAQLAAAGVPEAAIHVAPWCTRCRGDLFFSFRREREAAGRLMASVGRRRRP